MLSYRKWADQKAREIAAQYDCSVSEAMECVDQLRWTSEHVIPAVERGERPDRVTTRSLAKHCYYSLSQLQVIYLHATGSDNFLPPYTDIRTGKTIPKGL